MAESVNNLPTNRDENWRYANLRPLARARPEAAPALQDHSIELPATLPGYERWVFLDGHFQPALSSPSAESCATLLNARDAGQGFENVFPETFSFRAERHDPTELYLRLEDLWTNPRRLAAAAGRRDAEDLVLRLLAALPRGAGALPAVLEEQRDPVGVGRGDGPAQQHIGEGVVHPGPGLAAAGAEPREVALLKVHQDLDDLVVGPAGGGGEVALGGDHGHGAVVLQLALVQDQAEDRLRVGDGAHGVGVEAGHQRPAAARQPLCKGFAVGRSIFADAAAAWFAGEIGDAGVVEQVADRYRRLIELWCEARADVNDTGSDATTSRATT